MDEQIVELLACPVCQGSTSLKTKQRDDIGILEGSVICNACNKEYEITEGVFDLRPGIRVREDAPVPGRGIS